MERYGNEHVYELIKKAQAGDESAKNLFVQENMGLVYSIARRFYGRGCDNEDINQIGAVGLIKAVNKFNPMLEVCFSTYAVPLIIGEIKRFLRDDGPVKVSRTIKHTAAEAAHVIEEVQQKEGRTPGVLEIAKILNIPPEDIVQAQESAIPPESLFNALSDGNKTAEDFLCGRENENDLLDKLDLKSAVDSLPQREQTIVIMRYFLDKTQSEVAKRLGISQVHVSRLEKKILKQFRRQLKCEI